MTETESLRHAQFEFIDCPELAKRWKLPESWIREQVRKRSDDPIPHVRFGNTSAFDGEAQKLTVGQSGVLLAPATGKAGRILRKEIE